MLKLSDRKSYLESIENYNSRDAARKALIHWDNYLSLSNTQEQQFLFKLKSIGQEPEFYLILNSFVQHLNNNVHPTTVKIYFSGLKQYLRYNGLRIYN